MSETVGAEPKRTDRAPYADLSAAIGYQFTRLGLLKEALTHPNVTRGRGTRGYQRLEWLGDRVLGLAIADLLWRRYPDEPEGHLTVRHSSLVRSEALARIASAIDLGRYMILTPGESASGLESKPSVLADVCEAVIAAVYLDGGFDVAKEVVSRLWGRWIEEMGGLPHSAKTQLQEWTQARGLGLPEYVMLEASGPAHAMRFTMAAKVAGHEPGVATASSKQHAQEKAAAELLVILAETLPEGIKRRRSRRK